MAALAAALLGSGTASAAPVLYNFSESGWLNMAGTTETFFGSFKGTPEANGDLALADLSGFTATITETNTSGQTKTVATFGGGTGIAGLSDFLYTAATNSLTLAATGSPQSTICLGADVSGGFCGALPARPQPRPGTPPLPPIDGLFSFSVNGSLSAYTTAIPSVIQTVGIQPVPAPSATPEPTSALLCGGGLVLAAMVRRRRRDVLR